MNRIDAATGWSIGLWFVLGLVPTVGQSVGWHALLNHQGLAAWAQAVGTVLAVAGAAVVAQQQIRAAAIQTQVQIAAAAEQTRLQIEAAANLEQQKLRRAKASFGVSVLQLASLAENVRMHTSKDEWRVEYFQGSSYRQTEYLRALEKYDALLLALITEPVVNAVGENLRSAFTSLMEELARVSAFDVEHQHFARWSGDVWVKADNFRLQYEKVKSTIESFMTAL